MGTLKYDDVSVDFDDRLLAHLEIVIVQKLRRHEAFLMTWQHGDSAAGGRSGIWLHTGASLMFRFGGRDKVVVDHEWLAALMVSANSPMGLVVSGDDGGMRHPSHDDHDNDHGDGRAHDNGHAPPPSDDDGRAAAPTDGQDPATEPAPDGDHQHD
ncbi:hypothetical protein HD599_000605 [Conyzicola lurida]|uniref:DUF7882 domain-containing protein n=1 Tax=Conyzicola lurida TaxID=1172621 RepID=A0A841AJZ9_9MICO|nr:ATP-dependent DNA ligase [Conyzicola lurida]MBB5842282.1 hypothetical protein [Conyzicola lurida]